MKKNYIVPTITVQNVETQNILAGSDPSVYNGKATSGSEGLSRRGCVGYDYDDEDDF